MQRVTNRIVVMPNTPPMGLAHCFVQAPPCSWHQPPQVTWRFVLVEVVWHHHSSWQCKESGWSHLMSRYYTILHVCVTWYMRRHNCLCCSVTVYNFQHTGSCLRQDYPSDEVKFVFSSKNKKPWRDAASETNQMAERLCDLSPLFLKRKWDSSPNMSHWLR